MPRPPPASEARAPAPPAPAKLAQQSRTHWRRTGLGGSTTVAAVYLFGINNETITARSAAPKVKRTMNALAAGKNNQEVES